MANIKFSAFTQKVTQANVDFLVGYTGADNVRITPAALGDGIYLPLGGGTMVGNIHFNDGINANFGGTAGAWELEIYANVANDAYIAKTATSTGDLIIQNKAANSDIIFSADDGSGGTETYFYLDGSASAGNPNTVFPDNALLAFGNSLDMTLTHNAIDSTIFNYNGDLRIRQEANDKDILFQCDDGAGGVQTYFYLDGSASNTRFTNPAKFSDNVKALFGDGADLEIYHDGSHSYIEDTGTGNMYITGSQVSLGNGAKLGVKVVADGLVQLRFNDATKLWTKSTGIQVTGQMDITALNTAPASAGATGTLGEIRYTADHIYVCTATNTWKRTAISTW